MTEQTIIPTPADFPVTWERPEEQRLYWRKMGGGRIPPMMVALNRIEFAAFAKGYALAGRPEVPPRIMEANGYLYKHTVSSDPGAVAAWEANLPEELAFAVAQPLAYWQERKLPEIRTLLEPLERADLQQASLGTLKDLLRKALALDEQVELTLQPLMVLKSVRQRFTQMHESLFGQDPAAASLLQGSDTLKYRLEEGLEQLLAAAATGDLSRELAIFLEAHGRRHGNRDLMAPTWAEDPAPITDWIRAELDKPERPRFKWLADRVAERQAAEAMVEGLLANQPAEVQLAYRDLLRRAREAVAVNEEYQELMQCRVRVHLREVLLQFARVLTATGLLESQSDLWWLTPDDLLGAGEEGLEALVSVRRAEWDRLAGVEAPAELGTK